MSFDPEVGSFPRLTGPTTTLPQAPSPLAATARKVQSVTDWSKPYWIGNTLFTTASTAEEFERFGQPNPFDELAATLGPQRSAAPAPQPQQAAPKVNPFDALAALVPPVAQPAPPAVNPFDALAASALPVAPPPAPSARQVEDVKARAAALQIFKTVRKNLGKEPMQSLTVGDLAAFLKL